MASSTTTRQLARIGAVVVGGGVTTWWLRGEEEEGSNGNPLDEDNPPWPRERLVDHLHVTLTTPTPALPSFLPAWLLPSLSSALPPPQGPEEGQAEQGQKPSQHHRPPPLLFLSCADPFVIDNLVQGVFEKRPDNQPHVTVHFTSQDDGQSIQATCRAQPGSQPSKRLLFLEEKEGKDTDAALINGTVVLNLTPLLSLPIATPATNKMLRRVVEWIKRRQLSHQYNQQGQGQEQPDLQIVLTATNPLGLWRLQNFVRQQQQQQQQREQQQELQEHEHERQLEGDVKDEEENEEEEEDISVFHLEILGPTHGYLLKQASLFLGAFSSLADETTTTTTTSDTVGTTALEAESEQEGAEATAAAPSPFKNDNEISAHDEPSDQEEESTVSSKAANTLALQQFLSLQPTLGVLSHLSDAHDADTAAQIVQGLIAKETERLRAAFGGSSTSSDSSDSSSSNSTSTSTSTAAIILWDVLSAIHGERVDMLSQGQVDGSTQPGVVAFESVLQLCDNNFRILEALIAEGWVEFFYPELKRSIVEEGSSPALAALEAAGGGGERVESGFQGDERAAVNVEDAAAPPPPASFQESDEALSASSSEADAATGTHWLICRGSQETLQGTGANNRSSSSSQDEEEGEGGLDSIPLPKWLTTPTAVTMAWKTLEMDPTLAQHMHARADARHFVQEANILQFHRKALSAEWAQLHEARMVLRERAPDLTDADFIGLQLDLIRLEKSAASRALEMSLRCKRLEELHDKLSGVLGPEEMPPLALLGETAGKQPTALLGGSSGSDLEEGGGEEGVGASGEGGAHFWVPIEEKVLVEMGRGVRGVPVVDVTSSMQSSSSSSSLSDEEGKGKKASGRWWKRGWWPWRRGSD